MFKTSTCGKSLVLQNSLLPQIQISLTKLRSYLAYQTIVLFYSIFPWNLQKKPQRNKANEQDIKNDVATFVNNYLSSNPENNSIDTNWCMV